MSCVATVELCDARWMTQVTVGMLLLKSAKFASFRLHTTSSMMSRSSNSPAISRSEFVTIPLGFDADLTLAVMSGGHYSQKTPLGFDADLSLDVMSGGHCSRNTIGVHSLFLPTITLPTPNKEASQMPT